MCTDCLAGKQHRKTIPKKSTWRAKGILELIHSDICGPVTPVSSSSKRYILSFIDDYSRKGWIYFLAKKSEAFECFKNFKRKVEMETGKEIKAFRTDRGGEFTSDSFNRFCKEQGIRRQLTTAFTPQQNRVAERKNRTVMNMVVTLLVAKRMPKIFWAEAAMWTFHVLNRSPTKALSNMTPHEAWCGDKPVVDYFRVWGCLAHVLIPKERRSKLDEKSLPCVLVGVSEESKAYRLLNPRTMKIVISNDVEFEENKRWTWDETKVQEGGTTLTWGDCNNEVYTNDEGSNEEETPQQNQDELATSETQVERSSIATGREG